MRNRYPSNVEGDFYVEGSLDSNGDCFCDCLNCGLPQEEAPDLLAELNDENEDTYFIKQPKTLAEISSAIAAAEVCCTNAVRYSGKDKSIIKRMYPGTTDYKITILGKVVSCDTPWWHLW